MFVSSKAIRYNYLQCSLLLKFSTIHLSDHLSISCTSKILVMPSGFQRQRRFGSVHIYFIMNLFEEHLFSPKKPDRLRNYCSTVMSLKEFSSRFRFFIRFIVLLVYLPLSITKAFDLCLHDSAKV